MTSAKDAIAKGLSAIQSKPVVPRMVVQEIRRSEPQKVGRKSHKIEGVKYEKLSPRIPEELKREMEMAMITTHRNTPTIDTFIEQAIRVYLAERK